jgi:hypothetical protein
MGRIVTGLAGLDQHEQHHQTGVSPLRDQAHLSKGTGGMALFCDPTDRNIDSADG